MKSCTLFHSWLVLWHGHRSFKLTPSYSVLICLRIHRYLFVKIIWFLWYSDADHWFAIFFVLNFRDWVSTWVQQSMSCLFLTLPFVLSFSSLHMRIKFAFKLCLQQTIWMFFRDMVKGILLSVVLAPPIVAAIIVIVQVWRFLVHLIMCFFYIWHCSLWMQACKFSALVLKVWSYGFNLPPFSERRPLPCHLSMGIHVYPVSRDDDYIPSFDCTSFQQVHSCEYFHSWPACTMLLLDN